MEKKKGNGLVVFLLIVILAMGGFILYDKVLKEKYFSNNTNEVKDDDNKKEENNNNLYAEFLKNRKENINGKYKNIDNYDESRDYNDDEHLDFEESLDMGTNRIQTYLNDSGLTIESNDKTE